MQIASIRKYLEPSNNSIYKRRGTLRAEIMRAMVYCEGYDLSAASSAMQCWMKDGGVLECAYCGLDAQTWDHVRYVGGRRTERSFGNTLKNLVPCCKGCNVSKGAKDWIIFFDGLSEVRDITRRQNIKNHIAGAVDYSRQELLEWSPDAAEALRKCEAELDDLLKRMDMLAGAIRAGGTDRRQDMA